MTDLVKKVFHILVTGTVIFSLTACASPDIKEVSPKKVSNLDSIRFNSMLDDTKFLLSNSDKDLKTESIKTRLNKTALEMKTAQYNLAQKGYQDGKVDNISFKTTVETVTKENKWPRYAMFISQLVGESSPYLVVFEQKNVRDNYKIVNWVRLFPKTSITSTNGIDKGIELYAENSKELVEVPEKVVSKYTDYLNGNKDLNKYFAIDVFAEKFWEENAKIRESLKDIADLDIKMNTDNSEYVSFKMDNGSALLVTSFKYDLSLLRGNHKKDGKVSGALETLLGENSKIDSDIIGTYIVSIAFVVPDKKAKDKQIKAVGAERVLISATKK